MSETLFTASSPLGYNVVCSQNRWNNHILTSHSNMKNKEHVVANTISNPTVIYQSDEYDTTDVCFGDSGNTNPKLKYAKVIVANSSDVVSAWLQEDIRGNINPKVIKYVKAKL